VNNNKGLGFNPTQLYQECIQRGYEHADFTLEGFEKQQDIVDESDIIIPSHDTPSWYDDTTPLLCKIM